MMKKNIAPSVTAEKLSYMEKPSKENKDINACNVRAHIYGNKTKILNIEDTLGLSSGYWKA
jgi:hypothetical protein